MMMYLSIITHDLKSIEGTTSTFKTEVKAKMMNIQTMEKRRPATYTFAVRGSRLSMMSFKTSSL